MTEPRSGVLVFGNLVVDTLAGPLRENPRWNATVWVDQLEQQIGGNGANTAYTLATLGVPAKLVGFIGSDVFGEFLRARLGAAGVDVEGVKVTDAASPVTVALVHQDGSRAFLHRPGASATAFEELPELTADLVAGCTVFHLANPFAMPNMRRHAAEALRRARAAGLITSMDTGWDSRGEWMRVIGPCLPFVDLLFTNEDEARELTGCADADVAARQLREGGARTVIAKLGGRGCLVASDAGVERTPAFVVPVVDTTGAGDCFAGGFLAALQHGYGMAEAARFANGVGALSVQKMGAVAGIRPFEDTVAWIGGGRADA